MSAWKLIERRLFVTLEYSRIDYKYHIINDGRGICSFSAYNDEEAKKIFDQKLKEGICR